MRTRRRSKALTDTFNSSQSEVKVTLVNQMSYDDTFTKYKAGLASGDLPDVVQLQGSDQQQMIDTQTALPASACAKADKYSFSDFLQRVLSYFTVNKTVYAMPFNASGPVLFYNKTAFTKAGLDPEKPPATLDEVRSYAQKIKTAGSVGGAPLGLKVDPGFFEHWRAMANKLYVNQNNGRKGTRDQGGVQRRHRARDLRVDEQHGQGRSGRDQPRQRHQPVRQPARHRQRQPRDGDRHERVAGHDHAGAGHGPVPRRRRSASARCPARAAPAA